MFTDSYFDRFVLPEDLRASLKKCRVLVYPETKDDLIEMLEEDDEEEEEEKEGFRVHSALYSRFLVQIYNKADSLPTFCSVLLQSVDKKRCF